MMSTGRRKSVEGRGAGAEMWAGHPPRRRMARRHDLLRQSICFDIDLQYFVLLPEIARRQVSVIKSVS